MVLFEGPAQTGTYRGRLPASDFRNGGLLSSTAFLFARFNYAAVNRRIRQSPGISGFVHFGDRLALLPDALISEIRMRTGEDEILEINRGLERGQSVQIIQGPFQGLEALVTRLITGRDRVEILMEWMGRSLHAEASVTDLVPLTEPRP